MAGKKKKKKKKVSWLFLVTVSVLLVCAAVAAAVLPNKLKYSLAQTCMDNGDYDYAIQLYEELGDYLDARKKIKRVNYMKAGSLAEKGEYEAAVELYEELGDYADSANKINEVYYKKAESIEAQGDRASLEEAKAIYKSLGNYGNSVDKVYDIEKRFGFFDIKEAYENGTYGDLYTEVLDPLNEMGTYAEALELKTAILNGLYNDVIASKCEFNDLVVRLSVLAKYGHKESAEQLQGIKDKYKPIEGTYFYTDNAVYGYHTLDIEACLDDAGIFPVGLYLKVTKADSSKDGATQLKQDPCYYFPKDINAVYGLYGLRGDFKTDTLSIAADRLTAVSGGKSEQDKEKDKKEGENKNTENKPAPQSTDNKQPADANGTQPAAEETDKPTVAEYRKKT